MRVPAAELEVVRLEVPVCARAAGLVRRLVVGCLRRWGTAAELVDDIGSVLNELVTNAVQAAPGSIVVTVEPCRGLEAVEVSVWDDAAGVPRMREPGPGSERGRGLLMVDALALRWGHRPERGGKVVWAVIAGRGTTDGQA